MWTIQSTTRLLKEMSQSTETGDWSGGLVEIDRMGLWQQLTRTWMGESMRFSVGREQSPAIRFGPFIRHSDP